MTENLCVRESLQEVMREEIVEGGLLRRSEGVLRDSNVVCAYASDEADTYGPVVVTSRVCAPPVEWTAFFDRPIKANHAVIADGQEAAFAVPSVDFFSSYFSAFRSRRAVDNNEVHSFESLEVGHGWIVMWVPSSSPGSANRFTTHDEMICLSSCQ